MHPALLPKPYSVSLKPRTPIPEALNPEVVTMRTPKRRPISLKRPALQKDTVSNFHATSLQSPDYDVKLNSRHHDLE